MMKISILKKGDHVISVTADFVAVQRKNGEVDIIPIVNDETGVRVDAERIVTIGYGSNTVQASNEDVVVTTF